MNNRRILLVSIVRIFVCSGFYAFPSAPFQGVGVGIDRYYLVNLYAEGTHDVIYAARLKRLSSPPINLSYNRVVQEHIDGYLKSHKSELGHILGLSNFYFPIIERILEANGLPQELKYLTVMESSLYPDAVSLYNTTGLWQFTSVTGKKCGLEINDLVDERKDVFKSTNAACIYLKDLYRLYNDWILAIAAYNCGSGNVEKAIKKVKGKADYWAIYPYLPYYARDYVPLFIAVNYVMNYYAFHCIQLIESNLPAIDTVMVNYRIHFDQIVAMMDVDKVLLRRLNPQYERDIIPGDVKPRILILPTSLINTFVEKENLIASYHKKDVLFSDTQNKVVQRKIKNSQRAVKQSEYGSYKVEKGDSFYSISKKYPGYTPTDLMQINNTKEIRLKVGQIIKVPKN